MIKVNALGEACPIPVVKTIQAIKELKSPDSVEVLVDNEIAVQNLTKLAKQKNYGVRSQKLEEKKYQVILEVGETDTPSGKEKEQEEHNHKIAMLVPGSILEGTVENLMPYGAFIDLGDGISGLVHISQISQKRIGKPSEVLKEGQKVKVKVLNTNDNKVSLSMKALEEEMIDTQQTGSVEEYVSNESASTSLGDLLSKLKL